MRCCLGILFMVILFPFFCLLGWLGIMIFIILVLVGICSQWE